MRWLCVHRGGSAGVPLYGPSMRRCLDVDRAASASEVSAFGEPGHRISLRKVVRSSFGMIDGARPPNYGPRGRTGLGLALADIQIGALIARTASINGQRRKQPRSISASIDQKPHPSRIQDPGTGGVGPRCMPHGPRCLCDAHASMHMPLGVQLPFRFGEDDARVRA